MVSALSRGNRLANCRSPYLLQHAGNPVDWYPWGEEAFSEARRRDKPIFLSVGYSTCHWCHVMARESFENEAVAAVLNENYVSIKVDREERPDLDEAYMTVTQLLTGRGGWPNSIWLMPDARPWYAGTYFPAEDRPGHAGFRTLLQRLADLWRNNRAEIERQAGDITQAARRMIEPEAAPPGKLSLDLMDRCLREMAWSFDKQLGGFGDAPKFPPHSALRLMLAEHAREPRKELAEMITRTLQSIAGGGIHDQVGGGFHRYATDAYWFLPHFEKMIYDNALLIRSCAEAFRLFGQEEFRRACRRACDWALREMADPAGGFYSALDAESEGEEGKYYVWTQREIMDALGETEGALICRVFGAEPDGNYRDEATGKHASTNILYVAGDMPRLAEQAGAEPAQFIERCDAALAKLLERRSTRPRPHCDDKSLAACNGLMISGLAIAGVNLSEPRYVQAAERAAEFVLENMWRNGRLLHIWRGGTAEGTAFLYDYVYFGEGLLDLAEATGRRDLMQAAAQLTNTLLQHYADPAGGFFLTGDENEPILLRHKPIYDQALPSGNGVACRVLLRLGKATGETIWTDTARRALEALQPHMQRAPMASQSLILAASQLLRNEE